MRDKARSLESDVIVIPRLRSLRRVPLRCRRILPLSVMKRYQCLVIGLDRGELTVGITHRSHTAIIDSLTRLTGCNIFPVLVDPDRVRLLLKRIEYNERRRGLRSRSKPSALFHSLQIRSIIMFLADSEKVQR